MMSPSVILGAIFAVIAIFFLGYSTTHFVLDRSAGSRKPAAARLPPTLTENGIDRISIALGILLVGLAALLLFTVPSQWAVGTWIVLTVLGFVAGLVTIARWGNDNDPRTPPARSRDASIEAKSAPGAPASPPRYRNNGAESAGARAVQPEESIIVPCPNCAQKLRVPRRKSKLIITCTKCRFSFPYDTNNTAQN